MGNEINVGARRLRAIVFHEDLKARGFSTEVIIDKIRPAMHTILDTKIANLLIEFLRSYLGLSATGDIIFRQNPLLAFYYAL